MNSKLKHILDLVDKAATSVEGMMLSNATNDKENFEKAYGVVSINIFDALLAIQELIDEG